MPDALDRAEEEIEMEIAEALRRRQPPGPPSIGACHYCGEPLENGQRWRDADCERGWEHEQLRRRQNASEES